MDHLRFVPLDTAQWDARGLTTVVKYKVDNISRKKIKDDNIYKSEAQKQTVMHTDINKRRATTNQVWTNIPYRSLIHDNLLYKNF